MHYCIEAGNIIYNLFFIIAIRLVKRSVLFNQLMFIMLVVRHWQEVIVCAICLNILKKHDSILISHFRI